MRCSTCGDDKQPRYFPKNSATKSGYGNECFKCKRARAKKRTRSERYADYLKNRPNQKNQELLKNYGITLEEYNRLRTEQGHLCLICGTHEDDMSKGLHIDHCHETNKVRGLLCAKCNIGIGYFNDSVVLLSKAIDYLSRRV